MKYLSIVCLFACLTGCASAGGGRLGFALIGSNIEGQMATTETNASKTGEACASNILGIVASGDASIDAAKKNGGITKVSSVDFKNTNTFLIYAQTCTIVKGN